MMTSDDKVGGWVKKGQNHDDVILECPHRKNNRSKIAVKKDHTKGNFRTPQCTMGNSMRD